MSNISHKAIKTPCILNNHSLDIEFPNIIVQSHDNPRAKNPRPRQPVFSNEAQFRHLPGKVTQYNTPTPKILKLGQNSKKCPKSERDFCIGTPQNR